MYRELRDARSDNLLVLLKEVLEKAQERESLKGSAGIGQGAAEGEGGERW